MKRLKLLALAGIAMTAFGCSGGSSTSDTPDLKGKVEVKDAPAGTVAPGDVRGGGKKRDGDN